MKHFADVQLGLGQIDVQLGPRQVQAILEPEKLPQDCLLIAKAISGLLKRQQFVRVDVSHGIAPVSAETGDRSSNGVGPDVLLVVSKLNELLKTQCDAVARITQKGKVSVVKREKHIEIETSIIKKQIERYSLPSIESIIDALRYTDCEGDSTGGNLWNEYLRFAISQIHENFVKISDYSLQHAKADLRGVGAEILLQFTLSAIMREQTAMQNNAVLLQGAGDFHLPTLPEDQRQYLLKFFTTYNCELYLPHTVSNYGDSITEFDSVILSDGCIYLFDVTTGARIFDQKWETKELQLREFINAMEKKGVDVQIFIVLFNRGDLYDVDQKVHDSHPRTHSIVLHHFFKAEVIASKLAEELRPELDKLFSHK